MSPDVLPYAPVILKLLQDVLYYDNKQWEMLLSYAAPVQKHFASIGLVLHINEAEGYAYLTQPDTDPDSDSVPLPRLVRRTHLTYDATLLCVLLREALQQFETSHPDEARLVLSKTELHEMMLSFYPEKADMTRVASKIDAVINQVIKASFLRKLNSPNEEAYEVRGIIKAKISADKLVEIRDKLRQHAEQMESEE
jgi:hypothetical protein